MTSKAETTGESSKNSGGLKNKLMAGAAIAALVASMAGGAKGTYELQQSDEYHEDRDRRAELQQESDV